jgi:hypothetical protein
LPEVPCCRFRERRAIIEIDGHAKRATQNHEAEKAKLQAALDRANGERAQLAYELANAPSAWNVATMSSPGAAIAGGICASAPSTGNAVAKISAVSKRGHAIVYPPSRSFFDQPSPAESALNRGAVALR